MATDKTPTGCWNFWWRIVNGLLTIYVVSQVGQQVTEFPPSWGRFVQHWCCLTTEVMTFSTVISDWKSRRVIKSVIKSGTKSGTKSESQLFYVKNSLLSD